MNLVPDLYEAWHAGKSNWKKFKSINQYSIGIEVQNTGHDHIYENFSLKQIYSLKKLLRFLKKTHNINPKNILGHSDISPDRKKDPGEKFPWKTFFKIKLAHGHNLDQKKLEKLRSETNALQSSKNSILGAIWASQNHVFFEILAIKMKMAF